MHQRDTKCAARQGKGQERVHSHRQGMLGKQLWLTDRLASLKRNFLFCTGTLRARPHPPKKGSNLWKLEFFKHGLRMARKGSLCHCDKRELVAGSGSAADVVLALQTRHAYVAVNRPWRPRSGFHQSSDTRQCVVRMGSLQGGGGPER